MNVIVWNCSYDTYQLYLDLCRQLATVSPDEPEYVLLREELQSLPQFPSGLDEDNDIVQPRLATKQFYFQH
jgi:hypothetical protein